MTTDQLLRLGAVEVEATDMSAFEESFRRPIVIHWYPRDPRYRLSGQQPPRRGDIAWCGHVKVDGPTGLSSGDPGTEDCGACLRIRKINGAGS